MLFDALNDESFKPAMQLFLSQRHKELTGDLLAAIRKNDRDTMKEAQIAGKMEVYETLYRDLEQFAENSLKQAQV